MPSDSRVSATMFDTARFRKHFLIGQKILLKERTLGIVGLADLPMASGIVQPSLEALKLRVLADVKTELEDRCIDRFNLVGDAIDRVPRLRDRAAHIKQMLREKRVDHHLYIEQYSQDIPEVRDWSWKLAT